jgi:hypothetical protein
VHRDGGEREAVEQPFECRWRLRLEAAGIEIFTTGPDGKFLRVNLGCNTNELAVVCRQQAVLVAPGALFPPSDAQFLDAFQRHNARQGRLGRPRRRPTGALEPHNHLFFGNFIPPVTTGPRPPGETRLKIFALDRISVDRTPNQGDALSHAP